MTGEASPFGITAGPDGDLWFAERQGGYLGHVTTTGVFKDERGRPFNCLGFGPSDLTTGPDGRIWFTCAAGSAGIGRVTP